MKVFSAGSFNKIKRMVERYAKWYEDRFSEIAKSRRELFVQLEVANIQRRKT